MKNNHIKWYAIASGHLPMPYIDVLVRNDNANNYDDNVPFLAYYDIDSLTFIWVNRFDYNDFKKVEVTHWAEIPAWEEEMIEEE